MRPSGKWNVSVLRHVLDAVQQRLVAVPADFDAAEQIGLGARHLEQAQRIEFRLGAENLGVRLEPHLGAAPVRGAAELFEPALRLAARIDLPVELAAARHLDLEPLGERIDHRNADAVQAARGLVGLAVEFAAGVERAHDHFERGLLGELGMRIDRDAAPVVGDRQIAVGRQLDLDEARVAGQRLVHGVVDGLGEEVVQRLLVGAADIHAGPAPHRLQPLQHLDVVRRVVLAIARPAGRGFSVAGLSIAGLSVAGLSSARLGDRDPAWGIVEQVGDRLLCELGHAVPLRLVWAVSGLMEPSK